MAVSVCMVGYAEYFRDARIKRYVRSILSSGGKVDVLSLSEKTIPEPDQTGRLTVRFLTKKYQGQSGLRYLWAYLKFIVASFFQVTRLCARNRYSAVHVHNMPNILVFSALLAKLQGVEVILDVHDLMTTTHEAKFGGKQGGWVERLLIMEQRISAWFASHVVCADHMQKAYLESRCGIPADKITVIMNLPDETIFKPVSRNAQTDTFKLIYHGTIAKRLGIDVILRSVAEIGDQIPVHLSVYGAGSYLPEAIALAESLGVSHKVYFSGSFAPVEQVPDIVRTMDLGVIGNHKTMATDRFMMPVKLLEYVRLGIPVAAPTLKIIQCYFEPDMLAFYEPENSSQLARRIIELYRNPQMRERFVARANTFYDSHGWSMEQQKYGTLLGSPL